VRDVTPSTEIRVLSNLGMVHVIPTPVAVIKKETYTRIMNILVPTHESTTFVREFLS
jgi:hypothetical protein